MKSRVYANRIARNGSHVCTFPCVNVNAASNLLARREEAAEACVALKGAGPMSMPDLVKLNDTQLRAMGPGNRAVRKRCSFIPKPVL